MAFSLLCLETTASASFLVPGLKQTDITLSVIQNDPTLAKTGLKENEDEVLPTQDAAALKLSEQEKHEAAVWQLTEDEEKRYLFLMQNRSGLYYKGLNLTPIDILGINARNEAERNHFADLSAKQEAQKVAKNIAWNNAFHKAYNRIFAGISVVGEAFDPKPYAPLAYQPIVLTKNDVLYLFVHPDDALKTVLLTLIDAIQRTPTTTLHLLFLETDEATIQRWANVNQLPKTLVEAGRVTLNQGDLQFNALTLSPKKTPLLLLGRDGKSTVVDLGRF